MGEETLHRLTTTLAKLRQKIQQIRDRKEPIGEENTKAALVDPLLAALGWNVEAIDEVRIELDLAWRAGHRIWSRMAG